MKSPSTDQSALQKIVSLILEDSSDICAQLDFISNLNYAYCWILFLNLFYTLRLLNTTESAAGNIKTKMVFKH